MNRLELVQRLAREGGSAQPETTEGTLSDEAQLLVDWIDQAWNEIQTKHDDWWWMRSSRLQNAGVSFATVSGQAIYALGSGAGTVGVEASAFGKWAIDTFRVQLTSVGYTNETFLDPVPGGYDVWRDAYMYGAMRAVTTRPVAIAIGPGNALCLGPPPTAGYTVTGDYYIAPLAMADDDDEPTGLPEQFHMLIVYLAMTYYGGYEAAPEVLDRGQRRYGTLMRRLEALQAPEVYTAGPLA